MSVLPTGFLLAIDGSEDAALAARAATDLSNRSGADLYIVHAWRETQPIPPTPYPAFAMDDYEATCLETSVGRRRASKKSTSARKPPPGENESG